MNPRRSRNNPATTPPTAMPATATSDDAIIRIGRSTGALASRIEGEASGADMGPEVEPNRGAGVSRRLPDTVDFAQAMAREVIRRGGAVEPDPQPGPVGEAQGGGAGIDRQAPRQIVVRQPDRCRTEVHIDGRVP